MDELVSRACDACGGPVVGNQRRWCGDKCRRRMANRAIKERDNARVAVATSETPGARRCPRCEGWFLATNPRRRFCTHTCAQMFGQARRRRDARVTREATPPPITGAKQCPWCLRWFDSTRPTARFCREQCQKLWHRRALIERTPKDENAFTARPRAWHRDKLARRQGGVCPICGDPLDARHTRNEPDAVEVDHIVPRAAGGLNTWANVRAVHRRCNAAKAATVPAQ